MGAFTGLWTSGSVGPNRRQKTGVVASKLERKRPPAPWPFSSLLHLSPSTATADNLLYKTRTRACMVAPSTTNPPKDKGQAEMPNLHNLPYDLLLNIAQYLDLSDVHALQLVSVHFCIGRRSTGERCVRKNSGGCS
jgi:hypothetical protein